MSPESLNAIPTPPPEPSIDKLQETRNSIDKDFLAMNKIDGLMAVKDYEGVQKVIDEWKARVEKELHG